MYAPAGLLTAGLVLGSLTLVTIQESPQFSVAASVPGGTLLLLTVTWLCLLVAAARLWWRRGSRRAGALLGLTGLSWLIPEWDNPDAPSPLYAAALLLGSVTPALVLHTTLTWRDGRLRGAADRTAVAGGYLIGLGLLGLAPAVVMDPVATGCVTCPDNPWLLGSGRPFPWLERLGVLASGAWLVLAATVLGRELAGRGRWRQAALHLPALAFLTVVAVRQLVQLGWGLPDRSPVAEVLWVVASLALMGTALCASWLLLVRVRARRALGHILADLARGQEHELLRGAFAERLDDPWIELAYPKADGTWVDALGGPFPVATGSERRCTPLRHGGVLLALLVHSTARSVSTEELEDLVAATHLGLENEGLTARARAEEHDLRESGVRLLAARDSERRRLERDLHDGAQQRLLAMAIGLQLLARECPEPQVETARRQLALGIAELRSIAQGLSPPVLVDGGLVPALRALAETRDLRVVAGELGRFDSTVETTVYQLVEEATRGAAAVVRLALEDTTLHVHLTVAGAVTGSGSAGERIVTLGGHIEIRGDGGTTGVQVELPVDPGLSPAVLPAR